jgi:hypothetical protein
MDPSPQATSPKPASKFWFIVIPLLFSSLCILEDV